MYSRVGQLLGHVGPYSFTTLGPENKALIMMSPVVGGFTASPAQYVMSWCTTTSDEVCVRTYQQYGTVTYDTNVINQLGWGTPPVSDFVSFDQCGFTLDFEQDLGPFYYMLLGGKNLQAYTGSFSTPVAPSTADLAVTGVGFKPDLILAMTVRGYASFGFGATDGVNQFCGSVLSHSSERDARFRNDGFACQLQQSGGATALGYVAKIVSMDADGFTVGWNENINPIGPLPVYFLALKDPDSTFKVGVETQKTSAGTKATTGVGFQPAAGLFFGTQRTAAIQDIGGAAGPGVFTLGAASGVDQVHNWCGGGSANEGTRDTATKLMMHGTPPTTLLAEAGLSSWDADGFTLDWTTADAVARYFGYVVFQSTDTKPCTSFIPQIYRRLDVRG